MHSTVGLPSKARAQSHSARRWFFGAVMTAALAGMPAAVLADDVIGGDDPVTEDAVLEATDESIDESTGGDESEIDDEALDAATDGSPVEDTDDGAVDEVDADEAPSESEPATDDAEEPEADDEAPGDGPTDGPINDAEDQGDGAPEESGEDDAPDDDNADDDNADDDSADEDDAAEDDGASGDDDAADDDATSVLVIPVDTIMYGAEGDLLLIADVEVPADLVGLECSVIGATVNQHSVHIGNDLLIVAGDQTLTIPNYEDEGDIVHDAGEIQRLPAVIQVVVELGPDAVTSGGFKVSITDCDVPAPTPPTTAPTPSTTVPETSTPESSVPESSVPETTAPETTAPEATTPETTAPPTTAPEPSGPTITPETTIAVTSTTEALVVEPSAPSTPSTSVAAAPLAPEVQAQQQQPGSLPITGPAMTLLICFLGAVLIALGMALRRSTAATTGI